MAQCHKICIFLEHRVTFAMIYVKFNDHKIIISYSLWNGHSEMKIAPWKKEFVGVKFTSQGSCRRKLFKVFQLYTSHKCKCCTPTAGVCPNNG